jgi:hypothetical protein
LIQINVVVHSFWAANGPRYFLGLELQKLLIGRLSGAFIYEFLKSLKVLSVYESIKILLEREPFHVVLPGRFGRWAHFGVKSN